MAIATSKVTSSALRDLGDSATAVWRSLLRHPDKFVSIATETLFGDFPVERFPEMGPWKAYVEGRYGWIRDHNGAQS